MRLLYSQRSYLEKQLLIGTRNPARIAMVHSILVGTPVKTWTLAAMGIIQDVEEDGPSTEANAVKKARFYRELSGIPTLAIDGGVQIERFPPEKQPGVRVKRVPGLGVQASSAEMRDYYIRELENVGGESPGRWTASQVLAISADEVLVHTYQFDVLFTAAARGELVPGRILDALMVDPQSGKYYTELPFEQRPYFPPVRDFLLNNLSRL